MGSFSYHSSSRLSSYSYDSHRAQSPTVGFVTVRKDESEMSPKRIPKRSFQKWSAKWKEACHTIGAIDHIVKLLGEMPTHEWKRDQLVDVLGFRKNTEVDKGEQVIERQLLGCKGTVRHHCLKIQSRCCELKGLHHNAALSKHQSGQVIVDALGTVKVDSKLHPLAIEIKVTQGNCWSAVIQNIQQVRMLRANEREHLRQFQADGGVWGMVLAPRKYFTNNPPAMKASEDLLKRLKKCTNLRIALCFSDGLPNKQIECFCTNWSV